MQKMNAQLEKIMLERFGKDCLIALATVDNGVPYVRTVDGFYENGAFYVLTHALSNQMKQIEKNPVVAISGEWFTAHGVGKNLGWVCKKGHEKTAQKMRKVFAQWRDNGHHNFDDENTCILCVELTDGVLFSNGSRYDFNFK